MGENEVREERIEKGENISELTSIHTPGGIFLLQTNSLLLFCAISDRELLDFGRIGMDWNSGRQGETKIEMYESSTEKGSKMEREGREIISSFLVLFTQIVI